MAKKTPPYNPKQPKNIYFNPEPTPASIFFPSTAPGNHSAGETITFTVKKNRKPKPTRKSTRLSKIGRKPETVPEVAQRK